MNANVANRASWLALALVAGLGTPARADVVVVDPAGGSGSELLQAALDSAADGDIVLLKAGSYELGSYLRFMISGKGLTLARDSSAASITLSGLWVSNVPAGSMLVVRGLGIGPVADEDSSLPSLTVQDSAGAIWLEDCAIVGESGTSEFEGVAGYSYPGATAAYITSSPAVTLQRCTLTGGRGVDYQGQLGLEAPATAGGAGLLAVLSHLDVHDSVFVGGKGGDGKFSFPSYVSHGGDGLILSAQVTALLAGCQATGGSNGSNAQLGDIAGGGLLVSDPSAKVFLRDSSFSVGPVVDEGTPSLPIEAPAAASISTYAAPSRSLSVSSPLREGEHGSIEFSGQPGDAVTLLVGLGAGWKSLPAKQGVLLENPGQLLLLVGLGAADGSGQLSVPFIAPNLVPGVEGLSIPLQAVVNSSAGLTLEASTALTWLDSGV